MNFNFNNWLAETNKETLKNIEEKSNLLDKKFIKITLKCETYDSKLSANFNKFFDKQWQDTMSELNYIGFTASGTIYLYF